MDVKSKIITQFIRDLSFENPNGPGSFQPGVIGRPLMLTLMLRLRIVKELMSMKWSFKLMLEPDEMKTVCI